MSDAIDLFVFLIIGEMILIVPFAIFMRLGGYPEGLWRILRLKYFTFKIYDPDRTPMRHILLWKEMKTHSPTYFDFKGIRRYIDTLNTERDKGRPSWRYVANNAFPIPIFTGGKQSVDGEAIRNAFNSKQLQDYLRVREGKRENQINWGRLGLYLFIGIITILILVTFHVI